MTAPRLTFLRLRHPMALYSLAGVLRTIGYVIVAELAQPRLPLPAALDALFIAWHVILYNIFCIWYVEDDLQSIGFE